MAVEELDTEEKIKVAARRIFQEKGFEGAKTRDIAKEAGINLALMNYYFRSKKALFEIIMFETIQEFFQMVFMILNQPNTSFIDKIDQFVDTYIETLKKNPDVPLFILSCIKTNGAAFQKRFSMFQMVAELQFFKQFQELAKQGKVKNVHPVHFLMNLASMIAFPFIASPMIKMVTQMPDVEFEQLMDQRKKLVPMWLKDMLFETTFEQK